jgi:pimeloyl-ACP methyl ester carboxylesterase
MRTVYCLSGLGADHRIFARLEVPGIEFRPLPWFMPREEERMRAYAARMSAGITDKNPILLGVSFGGMMAIEIGKLIPGATVIIVSSIRERRQMPFWIKLGAWFYLYRLVSPRSVRASLSFFGGRVALLENYFLGVETAEDAHLCREFRQQVDPNFIGWAIRRIVQWQNEWAPASFYHIHGTKDRMFPIRKVEATHIVPNGGHLMVFNRAAEVSRLLGLIPGVL